MAAMQSTYVGTKYVCICMYVSYLITNSRENFLTKELTLNWLQKERVDSRHLCFGLTWNFGKYLVISEFARFGRPPAVLFWITSMASFMYTQLVVSPGESAFENYDIVELEMKTFLFTQLFVSLSLSLFCAVTWYWKV